MKTRVPLSSLCRVFRSKNASPFLTTIDLFFDDLTKYLRVRDAAELTPATIAAQLRMAPNDVIGIYSHDAALGIKITVVKRGASGDPDSADVFGAQQYVPLLDLEIE